MAVSEKDRYRYKGVVDRVIDGDTVVVSFDLGFHIGFRDERIRLYGINAPEWRRGTDEEKAAGRAARNWLKVTVEHKEVYVHTFKDKKGKYGRWLAEIWLDGKNLNKAIVAAGHAKDVIY